jgi:hypothetical protein
VSIARILLFAAVTLAYATLSFAQNSSASSTTPLDPQRLESIDSFIATQMANQKIPAVLEVTVESVQKAKENLKKKGCEIIKDEPEFPRCYVKDPNGLIYNLTE